MPTNLRELLDPIIAEAVNKAVNGYRKMLLGEDAPAPATKGKPGPKPKAGPAATPAPTAAPAKPGRKKPKKFVPRDSSTIAAFVESLLGFIAEHPGLGAEAIAKKMGGSKIDVSDGLKRLRGAKRVITTGQRSKMTYVAGAGAAPKAAKSHKKAPAAKASAAAASAPAEPTVRKRRKGARRKKKEIAASMKRVRAFVTANPGLRAEQIIKGLGHDPNDDNADALARLRAAKKVKTTGYGKGLTYSV